jgi:phosphoribosylaminoimidazolecarboxamide formyltransferase / IMP cyclohydrolase
MGTRRALLSVSDKRSLETFGRDLIDLGFELVSTGGTARTLSEAGLPVLRVDQVTGFPEILGGRVKTLHPAIHGGLLARRDDPAHMEDLAAHGIAPIELLVVNLYPFEATAANPNATLDELVEQIDIGGVALLRAGAKNHASVAVVCDPDDYAGVIADLRASGNVSLTRRKAMAVKAFRHTAGYDSAIATKLAGVLCEEQKLLPEHRPLALRKVMDLRYGENPHQIAALYGIGSVDTPMGGRQLQGKELSYNNLLDLDAAWRMALDFDRPAAAIIKHTNPCGLAAGDTLCDVFEAALACDPVSAFGSVIAVNRPFDAATVGALGDLFVEAIIAPAFEAEALEKLASRKNCRLIEVSGPAPADDAFDIRAVRGGLLVQARDVDWDEEWRVVSERQPTEQEWIDLRFAWVAAKHVKSNSIVFVKNRATVGVGAGQMSRVDAVRIGGIKAGERAKGSVIGSDAFFPFEDGLRLAHEYGVTAAVEPGGSMRDAEAIAAANELGMALVFTGRRHFRH